MFLCIVFFVLTDLNAQVLPDKVLMESHEGMLEKSINYLGTSLRYAFEFLGEEGKVKKKYKLKLYHKDKLLNSYDVRIRNLIVTCYFEISLPDKTGDVKTLTAVYDKGNKWMRVKFAPQENCSRPEQKWERLSNIKSFEEILRHIIFQIDKNLVLDCFVAS